MATRVVSGDRRVGESTFRRIRRRMWAERSAYLFIMPGVLIFSIFTFAAFVFAVWLTFRRWSIIEPEKPFVGTQNYRDLLQDERQRSSTVEGRKQASFKMQELFNKQPTSIVLWYPQEDWAFRPAAYDLWAESPGFGIIHKWSLLPPEARGSSVRPAKPAQ